MKCLLLVLAAFLLSLVQVGALPYEDNQLVPKDEHDGPDEIVLLDGDHLVAINGDEAVVEVDNSNDEIDDPDLDDDETAQRRNRRFGISYSPYSADGTCRNQAQVNQDLDKLTHYAFIRIYGVDCDQTRTVVTAARARGLRVFAGVFDLQNFPASLDPIIAAAAGDWSTFHTISIGNELVNRGQASPAQIVDAVHTARRKLRAAGYRGPVVTVDTFDRLIQHPQLCHASDYCAANCHTFFDANQVAGNAAAYVQDQARRVSAAAGGKRTVITETGWPHGGRANGRAVPSRDNQRQAIRVLRQAYRSHPGDLVLFSAFDDKWKKDTPDTFGAEKFWGIHRR